MTVSSGSSATDLDGSRDNLSPKIEALFLIRFDKKVGYTIVWKRTATDIPLENAVEYKSLPSGLHSVQSDLVYFTHEGYAGLSAFAKGNAAAEERNAHFVSVGILLKREGAYGRLGRSWLLAERLEKIAAALAEDASSVTPLEELWAEQTVASKLQREGSDEEQVKGHSSARAVSTVSAVLPDDETLPENHPAQSLLQYIDIFGPLVYRLQQAALLRKRVLFVGSVPVRAACEFVYILSVLSSIPSRDIRNLLPGTEDLYRLSTLFSIGVHDIPYLENLRNPPAHRNHTPSTELLDGWAACTTDEIISTKPQLYDIIVTLPSSTDNSTEKRWPHLRTSNGNNIKASQRDLARYKLLHKELYSHASPSQEAYTDSPDTDTDTDTAPLLSRTRANKTAPFNADFDDPQDDAIIEPVTWSRLAYSGYMWWASAGEKDAYTTAERETDRAVLADLTGFSACVETAVVAYFHRQTSLLVQTLSSIIARRDSENDEDEDESVLVITRDDISRMGLDTWSEGDIAFVQEFASLFFGRTLVIKGNEVDCCGLRVPLF